MLENEKNQNNGETFSRKMVLTIKGVVVRDEKEVLLLKRAKGQTNPKKYDLPGGRLDKGETIEEALKREVFEETGLEVEMGDILKATEFPKKDKNFKEEKRGLRFIAYYKSGEVNLSEEHDSYEWLSFDEALEKLSEKDEFEREKKETIRLAKDMIDLKNSYEGWRRALADLENFKKRSAKENEEFRKYCLEDFILGILPVLDNFELAADHAPESEKDSNWMVGILHIKKQLEDVLKERGVEELEVKKGDSVDTRIHDVIEGKAGGEAKVSKVLKKGYKMGDRVIRPASVEAE